MAQDCVLGSAALPAASAWRPPARDAATGGPVGSLLAPLRWIRRVTTLTCVATGRRRRGCDLLLTHVHIGRGHGTALGRQRSCVAVAEGAPAASSQNDQRARKQMPSAQRDTACNEPVGTT